MALKNIFKGLKSSRQRELEYAKMLNGNMPVFSNFGNDVYASDIVNNCIRSIATEIGKLQPKHIRTTNGTQTEVTSSINRLLKFGPNELMTTRDFLEKCTWLYEKNYNCFIYPTYELRDKPNGTVRYYTGFYPLNPVGVEFLQDQANKVFIKFTFKNGENYTLPYSDVIHWRKDFSDNDLMGGDEEGKPREKDILKLLQTDYTVIQGLDKAVKSSLAIRGVVKIKTLLDPELLEKEREQFEAKLRNAESGILPIDLNSDYIPITVNPTIIDKSTLEFVERRILSHHGVSLAIVTGDFTEEQYQAFYEKKLENSIIALGQAFSKTLFTERELDMGNEVNFYAQKLLFTNTKTKIAVADILGNRGALTDNQLLEMFGYPPFEGGDVRHMSLNFINRDIADQYQMNKFENKKGVSSNGQDD